MRIILTAVEPDLARAWRKAFNGVADVSVHEGSILDVKCDAIVSPANSFGFMDGGIDYLYLRHFGGHIQERVRWAIYKLHHGDLLVGQAEIVETLDPDRPFLIAAPTMRVPMKLDSDSINPYLATRAVFLLIGHGSFRQGELAGEAVSSKVTTVAFPGMGTGVGRISPEICARQMRAAFDSVSPPGQPLPASWAEASEAHQLLYTDMPRRLQ